MTDTYIEKTLINAFLTLNEFSGIEYIKKDSSGKLLNVYLPNIPFSEPADGRFFVISFLPAVPEPAGMGKNTDNRYSGIFQIDIMVPLGSGTEESAEKYNRISELFYRGKSFDKIMILKTYRASEAAEASYYRTIIKVEFTAVLSK